MSEPKERPEWRAERLRIAEQLIVRANQLCLGIEEVRALLSSAQKRLQPYFADAWKKAGDEYHSGLAGHRPAAIPVADMVARAIMLNADNVGALVVDAKFLYRREAQIILDLRQEALTKLSPVPPAEPTEGEA